MMDEDDDSGSGMGFAAGYMLGRMTAEGAANTERFKELVRQRFSRRTQVYYDPDDVESAIASWKAAVRDRDETIERLRQRNREHKAREAAAVAEADALRRQAISLREQIEGRNGSITVLMAEAAELREAIEERDRRIAAFEAANARPKGWRS